jgi:hypothetical protein
MVRAASLPAWAALIVEGARLLREAGWLPQWAGQPERAAPEPRLTCAACPVCPDCKPQLSCPQAELSCPAASLTCPAPPAPKVSTPVAITVVALVGGLVFCGAQWKHGRARKAPARRGGGVVDRA